ncbi:MAG: response regulator [Lachnospiraceae bacterium]|nr:response regulator [Lachnospiraceae bacterium]
MPEKSKTAKYTAAVIMPVCLSIFLTLVPVWADNTGNTGGGGYSATQQMGSAGYTTGIYDASNGLVTSDANYILSSSDGYIWIGGYSGVTRYDGNNFDRLDTSDGLTSARGLFEDSIRRIWVGTNDNGVVVLDGNSRRHLTYKDGLPSSSIRCFAEDGEGNVYIGTTAGVCYADRDMNIYGINEPKLQDERILRLDSDRDGKIYGQTKGGLIFQISNKKVTKVFSSEELGVEKITTLLVDPLRTGRIYLGTESDRIYYGSFGEKVTELDRISVAPLSGVHWINYDCNRIWISSISAIGYLDQFGDFRLLGDIPMNSGIEMMTSDYQGNMWAASSTQGVMKIVTSSFKDVTYNAGLSEEVANATCFFEGDMYIGTDRGLKIIGADGKTKENELTRYIGEARVRCIRNGADNDLWVGTFTNDTGLVHLSEDGEISAFNTENEMPDNEIRCICVMSDNRVVAGTNGGIAVISDGKVTDTFGSKEGLKNTIILSVSEGDDGSIYAGTDGDGIYEIKGSGVQRIGRDEGLTSDVILRIEKDDTRGLYWIVTSNSIEYLKNGRIQVISTFPYNNNYGMYPDDKGNMWVTSSGGIYVVGIEEMLKDDISDYRLYTVDSGLSGAPTAQGYCAMSDGYLYISCRNGICRADTASSMGEIPIKIDISSFICGNELIKPDRDGTYTIPPYGGRIIITPAVLDYSLLGPKVQIYMEGREDEGVLVPVDELQPLEYTGLEYGNYTLNIRVIDSGGGKEIVGRQYTIIKEPRLLERPIFRFLTVIIVALVTGLIVWRVMKRTVISRQIEEIKQAKEEAERANRAKSRFLANISHEIRTPINTIMGMNEMAMREDAKGVPKPYFMSMMNYAFDIRNASETLLSLINDLLDMSKIESGKMHLVEQEYDTAEMLRSVVSMIRSRSTEKELSFDVVIDEMLPSRMYGDQGKIKQIIINLLTNAVKYTDTGGISLSVSMEEREDDECRIRFSVKDTGIGIKKEDMEKLFEAYERLDEQKNSEIQGTGLGLDISRRFAGLLGGTITCESEYGAGSEFILKIRQKIVDKTPVGAFREYDDTGEKGPYVPLFVAPDADILVVDDNPMNLNVIKGLLKGTKVFVSTASGGEECLEKIRDTKFNVVLLDHMMPGMDGVETLAEIRKDYPDLPVYALTANSAAGEDFYRSKGFNGYLSKPIDSRTLEKTIMKHLPEEMMEKPDEEDAVEELREIPEDLVWIYDTEGIDVDLGIRNSGGISNFIFSLGLFLDTIEGNSRLIRDSYDSKNIRLYTIKVHSLKSSARIIGATDLSLLAEKLEDAGNRKDMDFIEANTGKLLSDYEAFEEKLERIHDDNGGEDKEPISEKELKEAYQALADMIPQMDYDAVEMILERVNEFKLAPEDDKKIKKLNRMLRNFEWDKMEDIIACREIG